jgi:hypothetical protein
VARLPLEQTKEGNDLVRDKDRGVPG